MTGKKRGAKRRIKPALNLILLGDPGAGKATQAALLAKKYSFFDFDMGRELTLLRQKSKVADAVMKKNNDIGLLTPTAIVRKIFKDTLAKVSPSRGIVFDGTPKMIGEAKLIAGLLKKAKRPNPLVIYLQIPQHETINRITKRKGYYNTKFSKRSDDSLAALRNRRKYYQTQIKKVTAFFDKHYPFICIDGTGTRVQVHKRVQKAVNFYLKYYEEIYQNFPRNSVDFRRRQNSARDIASGGRHGQTGHIHGRN